MYLSENIPTVISLQNRLSRLHNISLSLFDISSINHLASGNKLFKLALNVDYALENGFKQILSFGGAYSNHIHALALYGQAKGLNTIGIIRGEAEYARNPTLQAAQHSGMQLHFVDRKSYRLRYDKAYLATLQQQYPDALIVPEGGTNELAIQGCKQLAELINSKVKQVDCVAVACGTGGTLAGLASGLHEKQKVLGFPVVRDDSMTKRIESLLMAPAAKYQLIAADYGGYAKFDLALLDFILGWLDETGILLDPMYTSKMCKRLLESIENNKITNGSHVCILHTGGLQAWFGMRNKVIKLGGESAWSKIQTALSKKSEVMMG